jgi:hypothetical protein
LAIDRFFICQQRLGQQKWKEQAESGRFHEWMQLEKLSEMVAGIHVAMAGSFLTKATLLCAFEFVLNPLTHVYAGCSA